MRIGKFLKQSFIDWEGKVASVIFTKGCNFRCGFCHNPSLVLPEKIEQTPDISEYVVYDYLNSRHDWLDGVVITGGEPTIQNDLEIFIQTIKKIGYPIKLDTNGSNPMVLKMLIDNKMIDFVAMDIKTILEINSYQQITNNIFPDLLERIQSSLQILKESDINYQLRTTLIPKFHTSEIINRLQNDFLHGNYRFQKFRKGITIEEF